jgi:hypothetical protein
LHGVGGYFESSSEPNPTTSVYNASVAKKYNASVVKNTTQLCNNLARFLD